MLRKVVQTRLGRSTGSLVSEQRQRNRLQVVVFDPYIQFAFAETGLEALAGERLTGAANCLTTLIQQDAVAPGQCCQRADGVERLRQTLQVLAAAVQALLHGARHAPGQMLQALAQQCQCAPRMLCAEASVESGQPFLAGAQAALDAV